MLDYHITVERYFLFKLEILVKKCRISKYFGTSSVAQTFLQFYKLVSNKIWHACLSRYCGCTFLVKPLRHFLNNNLS